MDDKLKAYMVERGGKPLNASVLEAYALQMNDVIIPQIVVSIQKREQLAAEMRFSLPSMSQNLKRRD